MKHLLFLIVLFSSCVDKEPDENIRFVNNSKHRISIRDSRLFPDTSLKETFTSGCYLIDSNSYCDAKTRLGWSLEFERNPQGVITIFISDYDTVIKYGEDSWRNNYLILKRYQFTKDSLEKRNWTITYP